MTPITSSKEILVIFISSYKTIFDQWGLVDSVRIFLDHRGLVDSFRIFLNHWGLADSIKICLDHWGLHASNKISLDQRRLLAWVRGWCWSVEWWSQAWLDPRLKQRWHGRDWIDFWRGWCLAAYHHNLAAQWLTVKKITKWLKSRLLTCCEPIIRHI